MMGASSSSCCLCLLYDQEEHTHSCCLENLLTTKNYFLCPDAAVLYDSACCYVGAPMLFATFSVALELALVSLFDTLRTG